MSNLWWTAQNWQLRNIHFNYHQTKRNAKNHFKQKFFIPIQIWKHLLMAFSCFPDALNPFCRQSICISPCCDQIALATSSNLLYIYSLTNQTLSFITKFSPHPKWLSCIFYHPTIPYLLTTGGAPNSRVSLWSTDGKVIRKQATFTLQRVSRILFFR